MHAQRTRQRLASWMFRAGKALQSSSILPLRAEQIISAMETEYASPATREYYRSAASELVEAGLNPRERALLERLPKGGSALVLGAGVGREAIALTGIGFSVTALDFVPEYLELVKQQAAERSLRVDTMCANMASMKLTERYDLIWMSPSLYSNLPTRARRVAMLQTARAQLPEHGRILCRFTYRELGDGARQFGARWVARTLFQNPDYEPGDALFGRIEFRHVFRSRDELEAEWSAAGLRCEHFEPADLQSAAILAPIGGTSS